MAKNAFRKFQGYVDKPKRNVFDLSFQNNLTLGFGDLVPVFCKEVVPGDSFRIKPTFGFRMMPMVFPIQTKISANLHFFYVRNRNLWKDWPDFIGKTKSGLTPPYLAPAPENVNKLYKTGSLGDYLGIPTTHIGSYGYTANLQAGRHSANNNTGLYTVPYDSLGELLAGNRVMGDFHNPRNLQTLGVSTSSSPSVPRLTGFQLLPVGEGVQTIDMRLMRSVYYTVPNPPTESQEGYFAVQRRTPTGISWFTVFSGIISPDASLEGYNTVFQLTEVEAFNQFVRDGGTDNNAMDSQSSCYFFIFANQKTTSQSMKAVEPAHLSNILLSASSTDVLDITSIERLPYFVAAQGSGTQDSKVRISALPFRAYESIYNAFYRNQQNDPLINTQGEPEYNKFITNDNGGADLVNYELRQRNWEKDYLTTCVKSPQQGIAPLVGVSSSGTFTFENDEGTQYTAKAVIGDDGHTLTGIETMSPELNANGTGRMLVDMISHGISINDFRNVNALQRWLETNIRRGYRYKDQIMSHFGVDPDYAAMDMPEFIGGISRPVQINTVTQTAEGSDPLGSYAANATCFGEGQDITKYCDEHGFIIGILSVVPTPNYSQILPKLFLKSDPLDYYFPEFGHIGMQPILYNEVCPVQAFYRQDDDSSVGDLLHKTFGYQRAWYDYLGSVDEVHGLMRTDLRNFVMNRTFNELPELGAKFLHIDEKQLNQVFADTEDGDKIIGVIDFQVSAKRPIPEYGIPRLE